MGGEKVSGARLRAAREDACISLGALSARTHYSKSLLSQLENGHRTVLPEHVTAYSCALNISRETLQATQTDAVRAALEWLVAESATICHTKAGRRVGSGLADMLETRVVALRHLDDSVGGRELYPIVRKELVDAQKVVNEASYTEPIGRRLRVVVGELAQLAGWVASDAGHHAEAQHVYLEGVSAATDGGDQPLGAQLLSSLSYQIANVGDPATALLLARTAAKGARDASPVVRALLLERVAWASARNRDSDSTRRALDAVDDAYEERSPGIVEPEWVYWLNRDEIDVMAGRCFVELGDPGRAEPLLARAIEGYPAEHAREIAFYQTWLAQAYARIGDLDAARTTIALARRAADRANSSRLDARVSEVERAVA